jgi:hypothetical protein
MRQSNRVLGLVYGMVSGETRCRRLHISPDPRIPAFKEFLDNHFLAFSASLWTNVQEIKVVHLL